MGSVSKATTLHVRHSCFCLFVLFCFVSSFFASLLNYDVNLPDFDFSRRERPDFNMTRQAEMITEMFQSTRSHFLSESFLTSSM